MSTQSEQVSWCCKLCLLLWKNAKLMRRRKYLTCLELLLPLFVCLLLITIRIVQKPEEIPIRHYLSNPAKVLPYQQAPLGELQVHKFPPFIKWDFRVAYAPVGYPLFDTIITFISDFDFLIKEPPVGFTTSEELEKGLLQDGYFAGVDFSKTELPAEGLPTKLQFAVRFPAAWRLHHDKYRPNEYNWKTDKIFPPFLTTPRQPSEDFLGYNTEGFLHVYIAVVLAYAEQFTGKFLRNYTRMQVPTGATFRRCPYPAYKKDDFATFFASASAPLLIVPLFLGSVTNTVQFIGNEKKSKLKVFMMLMGIPNYMQWFSWLVRSIILSLLNVTLITAVLKIPITDGSTVFEYTEWSMLWLFLFTYSLSLVGFGYMMGVLFSRAKTATIVSGYVFVLTLAFGIMMDKRYSAMTLWEKQILSLLMNTGFCFALKVIAVWEGNGVGLSLENLWSTTPMDDLSVGMVEVIFVLDFMLYWLIALYVEQTCPVEYGVAQKWWYPVSPKYWCSGPNKEDSGGKTTTIQFNDTRFYEPELDQQKPTVRVQGLSKKDACKTILVHPVFMNLYNNQIAVLLENNGCGKTTIMNMLMGLIPPTSGTAIVNGQSLPAIPTYRSSVGICPTQDILFDELTAEEHIWFFCRLKGKLKSEIRFEIDEYLRLVDLNATTLSRCMSDGMKRKLSVCIALCGDSKVVFLDEPTLGMDLCARRLLYELLQREKCGRTILMATQNMVEADLLGDRTVILANGRIQCCGSPFYLKRELTSGYRLVCAKAPHCDVEAVTAFLLKHLKMVTLVKNGSSELAFLLADEGSKKYAPMFTELEKNAERLGLEAFGLSAGIFDDVLLSMSPEKTNDVAIMQTEDTEENTLETYVVDGGKKLICLQMVAMLRKKFVQTKRNMVLPMIQIMVPIAIFTLFRPDPENLPELPINYDPYQKSTSFIYYRPKLPWSEDLREEYLVETVLPENSRHKLVVLTRTSQVDNVDYAKDWDTIDYNVVADFVMSEYTKDLLGTNREFLGGIDMSHLNGTEEGFETIHRCDMVLYYNNQFYHSVTVLYHALMMVGVKMSLGSEYSVHATNWPLPFTAHDREHMHFDSATALWLGISMSFVSAIYVIPYITERSCGAKHLQFLSGVRAYIFWATAFAWDYFIYLIIISIMMSAIAVAQYPGWTTNDALVRVLLVLLSFGWAMLPVTYFSSLSYNDVAGGSMNLLIVYLFSGVTMHLFVNHLSTKSSLSSLSLEHSMPNSLKDALLVFPHFALCRAISDMEEKELWCRSTCNMTKDCEYENICAIVSECCAEAYFHWTPLGIGPHLTVMSLVGLLFFALVILAECTEVDKHRQPKVTQKDTDEEAVVVPNARRPTLDVNVQAERDRVAAIRFGELDSHGLVVCHLRKDVGICTPFAAVRGVSFVVDGGQCFGLVDKHGTSKTTLLRMLTGATSISCGNAWVESFNVRSRVKEVNKRSGYCPRSDGLLDVMTGRETLRMHSALRGIPKGNETERLINMLAQELNVVDQLDVPVKRCSGSTKRILSTAVALCGDPVVVYLDNPSKGMDANARRCLWNTLTKVRRMGKALVLSSDNMYEYEVLCTELSIMVDGKFRCLGSVQHLKTRFGTDYTLVVTVKTEVAECSPEVMAARAEETAAKKLEQKRKLMEKKERRIWKRVYAFLMRLLRGCNLSPKSANEQKRNLESPSEPMKSRTSVEKMAHNDPEVKLAGTGKKLEANVSVDRTKKGNKTKTFHKENTESKQIVPDSEESSLLPKDAQMHQFLLAQLPGAQLQYAVKAQLCYRVPQIGNSMTPLRWSQIFAIMERVKSKHSNIVDYSISESTLEQLQDMSSVVTNS